MLLLLTTCMLSSCSDDKKALELEVVADSFFTIESPDLTFSAQSGSESVKFESSVAAKDIVLSMSEKDKEWCSATVSEGKILVSVKNNTSGRERSTTIIAKADNISRSISVKQTFQELKDTKIKVLRVEATSELIDANAPNDATKSHLAVHMIDGDPKTYHNSKTGAVTTWPFIYDFYFENADQIDYILHTSRYDVGINVWGIIGEFELWVATEDNKTLTKYGDFSMEQHIQFMTRIDLETPIKKATHLQFRIKSGVNDRVSCAEMEFYKMSETSKFDYKTIFTDGSCSELKKGITESEINAIPDVLYKDLASSLFEGEYNSELRVREYRPYQHPEVMAKLNKTNKYSLKDNPTGIYSKGDDVIVFVGDTKGQNIQLNLRNYENGQEASYNLSEGLNIIKPSTSGLFYIYNHTTDAIPLILKTDADKKAAAAKTVKVNFYSGEINGFFDIAKHDNTYWNNLLSKYATYAAIDVLGVHSHVVWPVHHYREDKTDIVLMTNYIDKVVDGQKEFTGIYKYKRDFANRQNLRYDPSIDNANANDYRTAYAPNYYREIFTRESGFRNRLWVIGHEVGHTNQVRPGFKWHNTTEITNNLTAMYNQEQILGRAVRLDNEYAAAVAEFVDGKLPWAERKVLTDGYDRVMWKLVPLWQLKLYYVDILGKEDLFKDFYEYCRNTDYSKFQNQADNYDGLILLDFVRQMCIMGERDLLKFFEDWGFLRPTLQTFDEYGAKKEIKITQAQIDALKAEITAKGFKKPNIGIELHLLTDSNFKTYVGKEK